LEWEKPENLCPLIKKFELKSSNSVKQNDIIQVDLEVEDPEGAEVTTNWLICSEPSEYLIGDQTPWVPLELDNIITSSSSKGAILKMPGGGRYRIYVNAFDGDGGAATANVPIKVEGLFSDLKYKLPLAVYSDNYPQPWAYSGWMGNYKALNVDAKSTYDPHSGETCMKISYYGSFDWVGITWQHPANDWGDKPGGFNLTGARKLTFWAKGEMGGELIDFGLGLLGSGKEYHDSVKAEMKGIKLKTKWKHYTINLKGKDLSKIKTPFYWTLGGNGHNITFYLDDINFE